MKKGFFFIILFFWITVIDAQTITPFQYVEKYKDLAIREMKRMGVPAAITLAQGLLETESGNSELLRKSNNHFGIKCKNTWTAEGVSHDDDALGECFRSYKDAESSYRDHSNFLRGNPRYAFLFKLDPKDYKGWAYGLKKAGYATNPSYPKILIKNIEDNNLQQYTLEAVDQVPVFDASKYTDDPEEKAIDNITNSEIETNNINKDSITVFDQADQKIIVNNCKAIYALKGKSLLAIAIENNINLSSLLEYNDLDKDGILAKDQNIFLEKKQKEGTVDFYIVAPGETLYDVSQKNGVRLQSILAYNNMDKSENISAGTKLQLKERASVIVLKDKNENSKKAAQVYEVQAGEGLYEISKKTGVTVSQLKKWNNLKDDTLKIGQQLLISK